MPSITCPACDEPINLKQEDATLHSRLRCPECGVLLEVVAEEPLRLEWVFEGWDKDDVVGGHRTEAGSAKTAGKSIQQNDAERYAKTSRRGNA